MERLTIQSHLPISPLHRNIYRLMAMLLGCRADFQPGPYFGLSAGSRSIRIEQDAPTGDFPGVFQHAGIAYSVYGGDKLTARAQENLITFSVDVLTPLAEKMTLGRETTLKRDIYGLMEATSDERYSLGDEALLGDTFMETLRLLSDLLGLPIDYSVLHDGAPYTVVVSFDVDGFMPGQLYGLLRYLRQWEIAAPTFMVMAPSQDEKTIYDPVYPLDDGELRELFGSDCEIGLHSSFLAHDHPEMLQAQKKRLETASGRQVSGLRSHYYRFAFPRSWGHALEAGFSYDASLGYPDRAGLRNAASVPMPVYHPAGFDDLLWTLPTCVLDQHTFMDGAFLNWNQHGAGGLDRLLDQTARNGGILVLDWHVHGFESEHFPDIFKPFAHILNRARQDGARLCGFGGLIESLHKKWQRCYAEELTLKGLLRDTVAVRRPHFEIDTYKTSFDVENQFILSVERAAQSFLQVLPPDAEIILDIGSGPGLMNRDIPPFHKVICCDLDQDIISRTGRPGILGDIANIPLKDQAVTLAMACDVLEHLPTEDLPAAISELTRVSSRYIYLQVPLDENLLDGQVICPACGYTWHVNHHKNSFSQLTLQELMPDGWRLKTVNYTGEISYQKRSFGRLAAFFNDKYSAVGGLCCPECQAISQASSYQEAYGGIYRSSNMHQDFFPAYSEIGLLFEKNGQPQACRPLAIEKGSLEAYELNLAEIDFAKPFFQAYALNYAEPLPIVITHGAYYTRGEGECRFTFTNCAAAPWFCCAFPFVWETQNTVTLQGSCHENLTLAVFSMNPQGQEKHVADLIAEPGAFTLNFAAPDDCLGAKACLKFYLPPGKELSLTRLHIQSSQGNKYVAYTGRPLSFNHIAGTWDGVQYRWLVPEDGILFCQNSLHSKAPNSRALPLEQRPPAKADQANKYATQLALLEQRVYAYAARENKYATQLSLLKQRVYAYAARERELLDQLALISSLLSGLEPRRVRFPGHYKRICIQLARKLKNYVVSKPYLLRPARWCRLDRLYSFIKRKIK